MFAHMLWVGDALQITIPLHKGDQEGNNSYPRNLYANPLDPTICPILSVYIFFFFMSSFMRTGARMTLFDDNENNENRFSKWLGSTCKDQENNLVSFGIMIMKIETLCIHQKSLVVYPQLVTLLQTTEVVQSSSYIRLKSLRRCSEPRHRALVN